MASADRAEHWTGGIGADAGPRSSQLPRRWQPPTFTAGFRGHQGTAPLARWEAVLSAENSLGHRAVDLVARTPGLRRLAGSTPAALLDEAVSLEARERRAAHVDASTLGRLLRIIGRRRAPEPGRTNPDGRPKPGPLLDRELVRAVEVIADLPFEELQERGWHVQPNAFYWPLNDAGFLRSHPDLWTHRSMPSGIAWNIDDQLELLRELASFAGELSDVPAHGGGRPGCFAWDNGAFVNADAYAYYGLLRKLKPRRVVEVGAGASSLLLDRAIRANGGGTGVTLVEPYPRWEVLGELPADWTLHDDSLQRADPSIFEALEADDILFYDGSHCVRTGSDVNWMLFRILPRLADGVWIHFHDIFWPYDYPSAWILNEGLSWNEQYVLQAFLMHNTAYRPRLANFMLTRERGPIVSELLGRRGGASVWIQKMGPGEVAPA